jgi:hypothetical protein
MEKPCPICMKLILRGQTATMQNGLEFHSGCYANSLDEYNEKKNKEWADAMKVIKVAKGSDSGKSVREPSAPPPEPAKACCDDAIKTMLAANRQGLNVKNIAIICLTCNKVWTSEEARK